MAKKLKTDAASEAAKPTDSRNAFLKVFWDLAELNPEVRVGAVDAIISHLQQSSDTEELQYTLKRLVRGLASSRDAARQGFSTALTALLHHFTDLTMESVLELLLSTMEVSSAMKGMEQREHMFGRLFGLLAIHKSERLTPEDPLVEKILDELISLSKWKKWFREACYEGILTFVETIPAKSFAKLVLPRVEGLLTGPVAQFNADQVALAIGLHQYIAKHKLEKAHAKFVAVTIVARHHFSHLVEPLKTSSASYPRLHSAWRRLLDHFLTPAKLDEERFQEMWTVLVDGMLVAQSSTHERRGTAFKLFEEIVGHLNGSTLRAILTPHFVKCLHNNAVSKKTYLHEAAVSALRTFVEKNPIEYFHFLQHHFHSPLTCLVSHLPDEDRNEDTKPAKGFEALMALEEEKERQEFQAKRITSARMWALDTIYTAALKLPASTDDAVWTSVLQFFLQHAFFEHKKAAKKGSKDVCEPALSATVQSACVKRVFGLMGLGSSVLKDTTSELATSVPFRMWNTWASMPKEWTLREPLSKEHLALQNQVNTQLASLQKQLASATEKKDQLRLRGFVLLSVCVGLQLLDPSLREDASSVLQDLERCLAELQKQATPSKKTKKSKATESAEQPLVVLTDMLLSMLAQESSVMRDIVNHVFRTIMEQLDAASIQNMVEVVVAVDEESSGLEVNEEEADDDEDGAPIDPSKLTRPAEDDDEEENDDEEKDGDDEGDDEDNEEEEETIQLSELQREDEALSALVGHVNEKKKAKQNAKRLRTAALHFKVRVLDLLHAYAAGTGAHAIAIIEPLFKAWTALKPHSDTVVWSERVSAVLQKIARRKETAVDASALVAALSGILTICSSTICDKKQASVAATLVVFLVRTYTKSPSNKLAAVKDVLSPALQTLLTKKHAKIPRGVFDQLFQSLASVASSLLFDDLAVLAIEEKAVDDFSRSEVLRYLTVLFKAKAVTTEALSKRAVALHKVIVDSLGKVKGKRLKGVSACGLALLKARMELKDESLDALGVANELKALDASASPVIKGMVSQMLQLLGGSKSDKQTNASKRKRSNSSGQE